MENKAESDLGVVVRGNTVSVETTFLNLKIVEKPGKKKETKKKEEKSDESDR